MARLKLGTTITSITGKRGGMTYSNSSAGPTSANTGRPLKRSSYRAYRNKLANQFFSQRWKSLTDSQRRQWKSVAHLGQFRNLSLHSTCKTGFALFKRANYVGYIRFSDITYAIPRSQNFPYPTTVSVTYTRAVDELFFQFDRSATGFNNQIIVWVSKAKKLGYSGKHPSWRLSGVGSNWNGAQGLLTSAYVNAWTSLPPLGTFFYVKVVTMYNQNGDFPVFGPLLVTVT
jgi:hypothetical protein